MKFMIRLLAVLLFAVAVHAQTDRGTIRGTVEDPSGATITGAQVKATNTATGTSASSDTNGSGSYNIPALEPGIYSVDIKAHGFKTMTRDNVVVTIGGIVGLNVHLDVGSEAETITVTSGAPILKTQQSDVSTEIPPQAYMDLPLSAGGGRNPESFKTLVPGASSNGASINGGASYTGDVEVDGVTAQTGELFGDDRNIRFPPDAVDEMSLVTANYAAEYGETGNGVERYEIKSGTNQYHGSAYEYLKNTVFDARGYFNKTTPVDRQNEFGFTIGGPVRIPHLYNGTDKTFFFFNGDFYRTRGGGGTSTLSLPTAAMRQGDFSALLATGQIIYDPASTVINGTTVTRTPFPGNIIPANRISPVAQKILSYVPATTNQNIVNNSILPNSLTYNNFNTYSMKVDHYFNQRHHINGTYIYSSNPNFPFSSALPAPIAGFPLNQPSVYQLARFSYDWTISPTMLNQLRLGYNRQYLPQFANDENAGWPSKLGLIGYGTAAGFFPQVAWGPYNPLAQLHVLSDPLSNTYVATDAFSWTLGKHNLKFGVEYRDLRHASTRDLQANLNFRNVETADPQSLAKTGFSAASFLLGDVDSSNIPVEKGIPADTYWKYLDLYAQDDYKITPKLVLNYGLRIGIMTPYQDRHNFYSIMNQTTPNPDAGNLPGSYIFAGKNGQGSTLGFAKNNVTTYGPRFGFAWNFIPRAVLRGGYGISYFPTGAYAGGSTNLVNDGFYTNSSVTSPDGISQAFNFSQGFPQTNIQQRDLTPTLNLGQGFTFWDRTAHRAGQTQSWNLTNEIEIAKNTSVTIAYVGTKGTYLTLLGRLNQVNPKYLSLGDSLLRASINNPAAAAAGITAPWSGFTTTLRGNATVAQALRPFPQYQGGNGSDSQNFGDSTYHAAQISLEKRLSSGLYLMANYTWSKYITDANTGYTGQSPYTLRNIYDPSLDKTVADSWRPHVFVAAFNYELPIGQGKRFLNTDNGFLKRVVDGWQLNGILHYSTGGLLHVGASDTLPIFNGGVNADAVPNVRQKGTWSGKFNPYTDRYLNINAFTQPAPDTFGTLKYYLPTLRGPVSADEDFGLVKRTPITARVNFELRLEAFNAFNRVQFGGPNTDITNPSGFGQITGQANGPRNAQVVGKINF